MPRLSLTDRQDRFLTASIPFRATQLKHRQFADGFALLPSQSQLLNDFPMVECLHPHPLPPQLLKSLELIERKNLSQPDLLALQCQFDERVDIPFPRFTLFGFDLQEFAQGDVGAAVLELQLQLNQPLINLLLLRFVKTQFLADVVPGQQDRKRRLRQANGSACRRQISAAIFVLVVQPQILNQQSQANQAAETEEQSKAICNHGISFHCRTG